MNNNDNYLIHWKYISKKRVNGKWRYYYKNNETAKEQPSVSSEYQKELEFNSQTNNYNGANKSISDYAKIGEKIANKTLLNIKKTQIKLVTKSTISKGMSIFDKIFKRTKKLASKRSNASSEYLAEVEYNSRKNN